MERQGRRMNWNGRLQWWIVGILGAGLLWTGPASAQFMRQQFGGAQQNRSTSATGAVNTPGLNPDTVIQVDPETGSIIIRADEATHKQLQSVLKELDRPVPQVLINVLFLEVTHSKDLDLGVEGSFGFDGSSLADRDTLSTAFGVAAETRGSFYHLLEKNLDLTLRALSEQGKLEVLSRPSILTRNNMTATITVGVVLPVIRNSRITQDGQTLNTIEEKDVGIILQVTPFISSDGLVEMDLSPEISTLTGDTVPITDTVNYPVIAKRSAETRVVVADGHTVVIGGLMEDSKTQTVKKVPLLGDIPLVGRAFQRKIDSKSKTELLIFLTPHVVSRSGELQAVSEQETHRTELAPKAFTSQQMQKFMGTPEEPAQETQAQQPSEETPKETPKAPGRSRVRGTH